MAQSPIVLNLTVESRHTAEKTITEIGKTISCSLRPFRNPGYSSSFTTLARPVISFGRVCYLISIFLVSAVFVSF